MSPAEVRASPTQVVAVADATGRQQRLAAALTSAFAGSGLELVLRTHRELAAEASVEQRLGQPPVVHPDRPLLWLAPADAERPGTRDGRFLAAETSAATRSIAMLTRSPVLNRPGPVSLCGALPPSSALAVRRSRRGDPGATVRAERFTGGRPADDQAGAGQEVHDYGGARSSYGTEADAVGPFRTRAAVRTGTLVTVRVVGDRTLTSTGADPATLAASRHLAAANQLDLATVQWLIDDSDQTRTPGRIDGWHWDFGLGTDLDQVAEAIAAWTGQAIGPGQAIGAGR